MGFEAHGVDAASIRTLAACQRSQGLEHVDVLIDQHFGVPVRSGHRQSLWKAVNGNHPLRSQQIRALDGELTDRPTTQTAMVSPGLMPQFSAAMYPVGKMSDRNSTCSSDNEFGNFDRAHIGKRDSGIFGLTARIPAVPCVDTRTARTRRIH